MHIIDLCRNMDAVGASDLFMTVGKRPSMRVYGTVGDADCRPVSEDDLRGFIAEHLPAGVLERLALERDLDLGISLGDGERFRLNLFYQKGGLGLAVRRVPSGALVFADLHVPDSVRALAELPRGLILVTGATGSGKSTTMAAMLHHINSSAAKHIVTIEDPIEFVHRDVRSVVTQREVGTDTLSFAQALKHVVRQNPDVIFIGEMRDVDTIQTAISAAMTGHLVVSTMHTTDVAQTLERLVNAFPSGQRDQVAQDLGWALGGVVAQRLLPRRDRAGLLPVFEVLVATPLVRRLIAEQCFADLDEVMKAGREDGMCTFTQSLVERCRDGLLAVQTAVAGATNRDEFLLAAEGMEVGIDTLREQVAEPMAGSGLSMKTLLEHAVLLDAGDLILTAGSPPVLRIGSDLRSMDMPPLTSADTRALLFSVLSPARRAQFEAEKEIDFALSVSGPAAGGGHDRTAGHRFRVNGFFQKGCVACALRLIPQRIPNAAELGIPPAIMSLADRHQGLILVTGPTGHGKSTTLACLIDRINRNRHCHIITVEDPIEFVHTNIKAVVEQREVHADTRSFAAALKYVLRQAPDVILIGEMRDQETISAALTAAETGHLVLATLHTNDAAQTVDRIIDIFPGERQNQVRMQLAACLEAVVAQRLVPRKGNPDARVAAFEIMLGSTAVRSQIRDKRTHQLAGVIETSARDGMVTMERALLGLHERGLVSAESVRAIARNPQAL